MIEKLKCIIEGNGIKPTRAHEDDAAFDLYTPERIVLEPGDVASILTGVKILIPKGYTGFVKSKSGLFKNKQLITTGVVDAGYTGQIGVTIANLSKEQRILEQGDKIAQLEVHACETPVLEIVEKFDETERGENGFGSTGR